MRFRKPKKIIFSKVGDGMKTITRTKYLDRIIELNGTPDIKIITGIRRSGKSKLMQAYIEYLRNNFKNINIIFIDFMDLAYEDIEEYHALHSYVEEHYQAGKTNYLFVDEVQMCPKFELAINRLYSMRFMYILLALRNIANIMMKLAIEISSLMTILLKAAWRVLMLTELKKTE